MELPTAAKASLKSTDLSNEKKQSFERMPNKGSLY